MRYLCFLLFCSCSIFKTYDVSRDLSASASKVCLTSAGKGRLAVGDKKYIFSYESALDKEAANWKLALDFPLQKTELFELDWSENEKVQFTSSIDDKILKENSKINPQALETFTSSIGKLIQQIISVEDKGMKNLNYFSWESTQKTLVATNKDNFKAKFTNMTGNQYFGLMQISYVNSNNQNFRMDLVVKECFL